MVGGSVAVVLLLAQMAFSQVAVTTYHNDNARTGQNLQEQVLTPANVNSSTFGKIGFLPVQGLVDGEPLYVPNVKMSDGWHNVIYAVTEHDMVYAFDADTLAQLWAVTVVGAGETPSDDRGCSQVTPEIGITSAPVIDLRAGQNGTMYLVAMSKDGSGRYHQRLHALDLVTGAEQNNSPTEIHPTYPNSVGQLTFDPSQYKERAALLLLNGVVYTSFASHCDNAPYNGWIVGYSQTTLQQVSVFNMTPNGSEGAIWMAEGGLAADQAGNIYFLDGNGTFDTTLDANGFPTNKDFGNSFMKLSTSGNSLAAADYFAMSNVVSENSADVDLGSGSAILLPDFTDATGKTWHLAVGAGKDKNIYVVNRDSMGKFNPNGDSAIYQEISSASGLAGGVFSTPAYFNSTVYYGAVGDHLKAFAVNNARLVAPAGSQTATSFGYPGATPGISANGATNGILWAVENSIPGTLHAYDASNLANELYNSNQAGTRDQFQNSKFNTPLVANGRVFINCTNGVTVFGLLSSETAQPPTIQLAVNPTSGAAPLTVTASTSGSTDPNPGGSIVSSWINFGDGTVVNATSANHMYSNSGTYTVIATVYGSSGKSSRGAATVTLNQAPAGPTAGGVTPNSGTGNTQTFSFRYSDTNGSSFINLAEQIFNTGASYSNACTTIYVVASNALYLINDATHWLGPITPGGSASLQNAQCTLSGPGSSVTSSGNSLTVSVALTFSSSFTGSKNIYSWAKDNAGANSGIQTVGTWTPNASSSGHSVQLIWTASPSVVAGYNVYRGTQAGGPYRLVSTTLVPGTSFQDTNVQAGNAYFYTVTAVGSNSVESDPSNESESVIPTG
ncbi:MAG: PKD domain-containing protein [Terriglobales bacterium]